jgi:trehalose-6-phosphate synthase
MYSIETDRIADAVRHPETIRLAVELRAKYINKKVVVGVDVCQRLSGVGELYQQHYVDVYRKIDTIYLYNATL